jgi:hypothetical protein
VSVSGSARKVDVWSSGKTKPKPKIEDSLKSDTSGFSASNSKSANEVKSASRFGESSDVYDDDEFESVSKSHKEMNKILPTVGKLTTLKSMTSNVSSNASPTKVTTAKAITTIASTYTRKENK